MEVLFGIGVVLAILGLGLVGIVMRRRAACEATEAKERLATTRAEREARLVEATRALAAEKAEAARLKEGARRERMEHERLLIGAPDLVRAELGYDGGLRSIYKLPTAISGNQAEAIKLCKETNVSAHGVTLTTGRGALHVLADAEKAAAEALGGGRSVVARTGWAARLEEAKADRARTEAEMRRPVAFPIAAATVPAPAAPVASATTPATPPDLTKQFAELQRKVDELGKRSPAPKDEGRGGGMKREKEKEAKAS